MKRFLLAFCLFLTGCNLLEKTPSAPEETSYPTPPLGREIHAEEETQTP